MRVTIDTSPTCPECGRGRWTGDRFCGACGTKYPFHPHEFETDLLDLGTAAPSGDTASTPLRTAEPGNGSYRWRNLMIVLTGAATLAVALFVVLVSTSSTTPEATDALATPTPFATTQADTPTPSPGTDPSAAEPPTVIDESAPVDLPRPTNAAEPSGAETPIPLRDLTSPTPTPSPASSSGSDEAGSNLGDSIDGQIADLGLGDGWLATITEDGPKAVNLATGDIVALEVDVAPFGSILTSAGIYSPSAELLAQSVGQPFRQNWEFFAWDGSDPRPVDFPGYAIHAYIDAIVGPVAIVSTSGPSGQISDLIAIALETGDQQRIDVEVDLWLMQVGFRFSPLLQRTNSGFLIEVGPDIYRWLWAEGWQRVTTGRAISVSGDNLIVSRCDDPTSCTLALVGPTGADVTTLGSDALVSSALLSVVETAPDQSMIAQISEESGINGRQSGADITMFDVATGEVETLAGVPGSWAATWSPNSRYLLLNGSLAVTAVNVQTGELTGLEFFARSTGTTPIIFLDSLDDLDR